MASRGEEEFQATLEALHKRRRGLLQLKRMGSPEYDEAEFQELRAYIDEFQEALEVQEVRRHQAAAEGLDSILTKLTTTLRG